MSRSSLASCRGRSGSGATPAHLRSFPYFSRRAREPPHRKGKVFTGRSGSTPHCEVLFDRICRGNGIRHMLTVP